MMIVLPMPVRTKPIPIHEPKPPAPSKAIRVFCTASGLYPGTPSRRESGPGIAGCLGSGKPRVKNDLIWGFSSCICGTLCFLGEPVDMLFLLLDDSCALKTKCYLSAFNCLTETA